MILRFTYAQERAYPYAKARVGGPYETFEEQIAARPALSERYPDCNLSMEYKNVAMKKAAAMLGAPKIEERTNA